ncbi:MAG: transglutaminase-like domain-containing protein [Planctomycetota bacterium]|jgi:hypothetical protein
MNAGLHLFWIGWLALFTGPVSQEGDPAARQDTRLFSVEMQNRVLGYRIERRTSSVLEGRPVKVFSTKTLLRTGPEAKGASGKLETKEFYWIDEKTGTVLRALSEFRQGKTFMIRKVEFGEDQAGIKVIHQDGSEPARTVPLPPDVMIPCPAEAPVLALIDSGRDELSMKVFDLNEGEVEEVTARRLGADSLEIEGETNECRRFRVDTDDPVDRILLWLDESGRVIRMEQPAMGITYKHAPEKVMEKLAEHQEEESASGGLPALEDRPGLTFLKLRATILCPAVRSAESLNTKRQAFEGTVEDGRIDGIFRLRSQHLDRLQDIAFPMELDESRADDPDLLPAEGIESDAPLIREKAQQITKDLKRRWHGVHALAAWVRKNITLDVGAAESALDALESKKATVKGMARLYCALCRSAGIPARVVMGAIYAGSDKGTARFVEHHWNEVHMAEAGWTPLDVAAGTLTFLDAGHLRLARDGSCEFSGVEIMDYIPKPEELRPAVPTKAGPFPLPRGEFPIYEYFLEGKHWGRVTVVFEGEKRSPEGEMLYYFSSMLDLTTLSGQSVTRAYLDGRFHSYDAKMGDAVLSCRAEDGEALCELTVEGETRTERVTLPREGLFYDSHQVLQLGLLLSRLDVKPGDPVQVSIFQPTAMRNLNLQVECKGLTEIVFQGEKRKARIYELTSGSQKMVVTLAESGLILEILEQGGAVRIVLRGDED